MNYIEENDLNNGTKRKDKQKTKITVEIPKYKKN